MLLPIWICVLIPSLTNGRSITQSYPLATTTASTDINIGAFTEYSLIRNDRNVGHYQEESRGMIDDNTDHMTSNKAIKNDPWQGYYDFIINEGSFKFWAVFQVVTAAILIYSSLAAVYYAKYNYIQADYDYGDYFFRRSLLDSRSTNTKNIWSGLNLQTFQRILDAVSSKKYS